jgi:hypothetical protein
MKRSPWLPAALGLLLLVGLPCAPGQEPASQAAPTSLPTLNYTDVAFGFELEIPAGWNYDRTRFQDFKNSIGLLRGRSADGRRGLKIVVFRSYPMRPFEDWLVVFGRDLAERADVARVEGEPWQLPPRAGAILTYASKAAGVKSRSHHLCVPFDPNTVWVLVYSGNAAGDAEERQLRAEFDRLSATLRVYYTVEDAEQLAGALDRGKALLDKLRAQAERVQLDETEYTYDIALAGKSVGYLRRRISREEYVFSQPDAKRRYAKNGVRVRERSWRFADDGTVRCTRVDLFTSFDLKSELIESRQTQIPAPDVTPQELLVKTNQVLREDDRLFSSFTTSRDRNLPDPGKPISVGPVYLGLAWVRLLPALLLGEPAERHALVIYDDETRALLSHMVQPLGEVKLPGRDEPLYGFEVREGYIAQPSVVYTDRRGNLIRLEAGEVVLARVPKEEAERKYGERRDAARQRFQIKDD